MATPKLLMICPNGEFGGAERTALNFAKELNARGNFTVIVALLRRGPMEKELARYGIEFRHTDEKFRLSRPGSWFRVLKQLQRIVQRDSIDLIHGEMAYGQIVGGLLSMISRKPNIWYQHGPIDSKSLQQRLAAILPSSGYLTNSSYSLSQQPLLLFSGKRAVLPPPLGADFLSAPRNLSVRARLGIQPNEKMILLAARFQQSFKGHQLALNGFARISEKFPQAKLVLLGAPIDEKHRDFPDFKAVQTTADAIKKKNGNPQSIAILPFDTDIIPYLDAADILVNTTLIPEPFGCTIIEAMSRGCLVLAGNAGGVKDINLHAPALITYALGEVEDFSRALEFAVAMPTPEREERGRLLRASAEFYSVHQIVPKLERFYSDILSLNASG